MARFNFVALFFLLATLITHVFTFPLLRRYDISQLQADLQLATGDVTTLSQDIDDVNYPQTDVAQGESFTAAFSTTSNDIQRFITDVNSITAGVTEADAQILLKLAQDFANSVTGMLGTLQKKYYTFKKLNMVSSILSQVRNLNGGVTQMTGKLQSVLPSQSQGVANGLEQQMGPAFQQTISLYSK